ncbi:MAG TPA: D-2-hydroxyacid dehydrogenase [Opitutaceae bacterium]
MAKIWCNASFNENATRRLHDGVGSHELIMAAPTGSSVLLAGGADPRLNDADIAFGQPNAEQAARSPRLRWVHITSAGYTRYDTPDFREQFRRRNAYFTNSSSVFADPCAQHVLAQMLALGRQLFPADRAQIESQSWDSETLRYNSRLLTGQTVLFLGYGAIGRRLRELLAPFNMTVYAVRRRTYSEPGVNIISEERLSSVLGQVDHVINVLPDNESTRNYINARRLAWCRPGTRFYNIGRGTTVDQNALLEALQSGRLGAACLDVTDPEPLPRSHPLWTAPNCFITPHTAGGRHDQDEALVAHFLSNLRAFEAKAPMVDMIM